jgi:hypothetical protein
VRSPHRILLLLALACGGAAWLFKHQLIRLVAVWTTPAYYSPAEVAVAEVVTVDGGRRVRLRAMTESVWYCDRVEPSGRDSAGRPRFRLHRQWYRDHGGRAEPVFLDDARVTEIVIVDDRGESGVLTLPPAGPPPTAATAAGH